MALDGPLHAVEPERIAGGVKDLLARRAQHEAAGFGGQGEFSVIIGGGYAVAMQGLGPVQLHLSEADAFRGKRRDMAKAQCPHVLGLLLGLHEDRYGLGQGLRRKGVEMIEMVHVGDDDRIHGNDGFHRERQLHQRIGQIVVGRGDGRAGAARGEKGIDKEARAAEGDDARCAADLLELHEAPLLKDVAASAHAQDEMGTLAARAAGVAEAVSFMIAWAEQRTRTHFFHSQYPGGYHDAQTGRSP